MTYEQGSAMSRCRISLMFKGIWWAQQDSNLRLRPCKGGTLPPRYAPLVKQGIRNRGQQTVVSDQETAIGER